MAKKNKDTSRQKIREFQALQVAERRLKRQELEDAHLAKVAALLDKIERILDKMDPEEKQDV